MMRRSVLWLALAATTLAGCAAVGMDKNVYWMTPPTVSADQMTQISFQCREEVRGHPQQPAQEAAAAASESGFMGYRQGDGLADPLWRRITGRDQEHPEPNRPHSGRNGLEQCYTSHGMVGINLTFNERERWLALQDADARLDYLRSIVASNPDRVVTGN